MNSKDMIAVSEVQLESDPNQGNKIILKEKADSDHFFMMFVGDSEFAAIAKEKGLVDPKRPLTHELYLGILEKLTVQFLRVEIYEVRQETFYANVFLQADGVEQAIDSRPSDAVALALNRKIPILINQTLFRRKLTQKEIKEFEGLIKTVKF
jgi:bifunctional DNase/RNase